jgi:hypothetical protein
LLDTSFDFAEHACRRPIRGSRSEHGWWGSHRATEVRRWQRWPEGAFGRRESAGRPTGRAHAGRRRGTEACGGTAVPCCRGPTVWRWGRAAVGRVNRGWDGAECGGARLGSKPGRQRLSRSAERVGGWRGAEGGSGRRHGTERRRCNICGLPERRARRRTWRRRGSANDHRTLSQPSCTGCPRRRCTVRRPGWAGRSGSFRGRVHHEHGALELRSSGTPKIETALGTGGRGLRILGPTVWTEHTTPPARFYEWSASPRKRGQRTRTARRTSSARCTHAAKRWPKPIGVANISAKIAATSPVPQSMTCPRLSRAPSQRAQPYRCQRRSVGRCRPSLPHTTPSAHDGVRGSSTARVSAGRI